MREAVALRRSAPAARFFGPDGQHLIAAELQRGAAERGSEGRAGAQRALEGLRQRLEPVKPQRARRGAGRRKR